MFSTSRVLRLFSALSCATLSSSAALCCGAIDRWQAGCERGLPLPVPCQAARAAADGDAQSNRGCRLCQIGHWPAPQAPATPMQERLATMTFALPPQSQHAAPCLPIHPSDPSPYTHTHSHNPTTTVHMQATAHRVLRCQLATHTHQLLVLLMQLAVADSLACEEGWRQCAGGEEREACMQPRALRQAVGQRRAGGAAGNRARTFSVAASRSTGVMRANSTTLSWGRNCKRGGGQERKHGGGEPPAEDEEPGSTIGAWAASAATQGCNKPPTQPQLCAAATVAPASFLCQAGQKLSRPPGTGCPAGP
jgi:hypothetical protein